MRKVFVVLGALLILGCKAPSGDDWESIEVSTRQIAWTENGKWFRGTVKILETEPRMECITNGYRTLSCRVVADDYPGLRARVK